MDDGATKTKKGKDTADAKPQGDMETVAYKFMNKSSPCKARNPVPARVTMRKDEFEGSSYKMDYPSRGKALIINNKKFQSHLRLNDRNGTDVDAAAMHQVLGLLDFDVNIEHNRTAEQMQQLIEDISLEDHNDSDCFCCVILSHGEEGIVYGVDSQLDVRKLFEPLKGNNCPSLIGKPKIFFIQACRGQEFDQGADVTVADAIGEVEVEEPVVVRKIPTEADFLIAYSVVPGHYSWRNSSNGSWFIQALSSVLEKYGQNGQMDLLKMMTRVNCKVAIDFQSNTSDPYMSKKKQIPCITSMLTKEVYFTPK